MKLITEKANKVKEFKTMKVAKQLQKQELAKQYDELVASNQAKPEAKVEEKVVIPKEEKTEVKPEKKKKVIKKVIYQEASSSDSDGADEVEVVRVKKSHKRVEPVAPKKEEIPPPQNKENTYTNL